MTETFGSATEIRCWIASLLPGAAADVAASFVCDRQSPHEMRCVVDVPPGKVGDVLDRAGGMQYGNGTVVLAVRLAPGFECRPGRSRQLRSQNCSCCHPRVNCAAS